MFHVIADGSRTGEQYALDIVGPIASLQNIKIAQEEITGTADGER